MNKTKFNTLFAVLIILLAWALPQKCGAQTGLKQQFEQKLSQLLGITVAVEDYRLEYSTIHLRNIKIGDQTLPEMPFIRVKKLSGTCDIMSLFGGNLVLKDVSISSLTCELTRNEAGEFITGKASQTRQVTEKRNVTVADLPFLKLNIADLTLKINDKRSKRILTTLINTATLAKSKSAEQLSVDLSGSAAAKSNLGKQTGDFNTSFTAKIELSGTVAAPAVQGTMSIKDLQLTNQVLGQTIKVAQGSFSFDENAIKAHNFTATWGKSLISA